MRFLKVLIPVLLLASLAFNLILIGKTQSRRKIMTINGQSVTQKDKYDILDQTSGKTILAAMAQRILVDQQAQKANVVPTDKEIDEELANLKEANWQLAREMANNPWKEGEQRKAIKQQLEVARLRAKDVKVTDDEIQSEYKLYPMRYDTPNKAKVSLALVLDESRVNDIKQLLEQKVSPSVIMQNNRKAVVFIGDNYRYTLAQPLGTKVNDKLFRMKPGDVMEVDDPNFRRMGAKKEIIRLEEIIPGHKADLNDPKTKEKIRLVIALQRAKNWTEMLQGYWNGSDIATEDPSDKDAIKNLLFPEH